MILLFCNHKLIQYYYIILYYIVLYLLYTQTINVKGLLLYFLVMENK